MSAISDLWKLGEIYAKNVDMGQSEEQARNNAVQTMQADKSAQLNAAKDVGNTIREAQTGVSYTSGKTPDQIKEEIASGMSGVNTTPASDAFNKQYDLYAQNRATQEMVNAAQEDVRNAQNQNAIEEIEASNKANQAARTSGATNYAAGSAATDASHQTNNTGNYYANARNLGTSTQADWLGKQGYAQGQEVQAKNTKAGAFLNTLGSVFGGAGTGAQVGGSIGNVIGGGK